MTTQDRQAILHTAVKTYGRHAQEDMALEEMSELTKAILKLRRVSAGEALTDEGLKEILESRRSDIIEEMADAQIMLDQLRIIFGSTAEAEDLKLTRLADRLGYKVPGVEIPEDARSCFFCENLILDGLGSWCNLHRAGELCEGYELNAERYTRAKEGGAT